MPLAGFEPTIPVFKRANTFHALDRAATVTVPEIWLKTLTVLQQVIMLLEIYFLLEVLTLS
jgi:hypothetical protein